MGTLGEVILEAGNFVLPNEEVQDHEQQAQFLPRVHWPSEHDANESQAQPLLNLDIDWLDAAAVNQLYECVSDTYPHLTPMPPYGTADNNVYDGCQWSEHLAIAHNLFHKTLQNGEGLNDLEMMALVRIVTYGIFNSTTFFVPFIVNGAGGTNRDCVDANQGREAWELQWVTYTRTGEVMTNFRPQDIESSKRRIWTRRWVVVPVLHGRSQWGMTIFDRYKGQLYIFDCGDDQSKNHRIMSTVEAWVALLHNLGQPYSFQYFVPRVMKQLDERDSGLLCIIWLMDMLRNQVGRPMTSRDDSVTKVNILAGNSPRGSSGTNHHDNYTSSLRLRDWVPRGCCTPKARLMAVRRILRVMVANELGLRNHPFLTHRYRDRRKQGDDAHPSAFWLLKEAARELANTGGTMAKEAFFTGHGGLQFALPQRRSVLPYDAEAPRRHTIHKLPGRRHQTRITTEDLNAWAKTPFDWPDDRSRSSARLSGTAPMPDLDLIAADGFHDPSQPEVELFRNSEVPETRVTRSMSRLNRERSVGAGWP